MRISAKKYAQALFDSAEGKNKDEIKKIIGDFLKVLALNNDFAKADLIIEEYEKIKEKKDGIMRASIASAIKLENETIDFIRVFIKNKIGAKNIKINQEIKKELLGGVVIRYEDKVIDGSLKTRIRELKDKISK